ncbi:MAG: bacillithiol biosynthesis BshC [Gemmatimonadaceae bacterium]
MRVITEPLGPGPLACAALAGETPAGWFDVTAPGAWRARVGGIRSSHDAGWLDAMGPAFGAIGGAAGERLARAAGGSGVVVTTGQQPGLFGGPIYTWTKALSALALADALERETGAPVAPVFWAATDDADFAEARDTLVAVPGGVERISLEKAPPDGTPMFAAPLGDVARQLAALERGAGSAAYLDALRCARDSYVAGETVGGAYVRLLRTLLEPLGIAVLDVGHPAFRTAASPYLREALSHAAALDVAARERAAALSEAGFEQQVAEVKGLSLVFAGMESSKQRVPLDRASQVAASARPGDLGATVLLRPALERRLLPTAAYVAGPGELAYFTQVSAVADALGWERPRAVPRWSATIVEPHVRRILERYGLRMEDFHNPRAIETRLAQAAVPPAATDALRELREAADRAAQSLRSARADGGEPVLPRPAVDGFRGQLERRFERLERRLLAATKRRETALMRDLGTAEGSLYPMHKRQERALNFLPILARHGPQLVDEMLAQARAHAASLVAAPTLPPSQPAEISLL